LLAKAAVATTVIVVKAPAATLMALVASTSLEVHRAVFVAHHVHGMGLSVR
jgi:hypothetical protein